MRRLGLAACLGGLALTVMAPAAVHAQSRPEQQAEAALIVTARRVAEQAEAVPVSLSRLDEAQLRRRNAGTLADVARLVPGFSVPIIGSFGAQQPVIRGVFSNIGASTIGLYVDDVPVQIRSLEVAGNPDLRSFDIDRVEVLRGPQGTLFGANSMGGTIRYLTRQPRLEGDEAQASGQAAAVRGGGLSHEVQAAFGAAMVPGRLGVRLSGYYRRDAGVVDRIDPATGDRAGDDIDSVSALGLRLAAKAALGERLELTPALFYQKSRRADLPFYESDLGPFRQSASLRQPGRDRLLLPSLTARVDLGGATLTSVTALLERHNRQIVDYSGFFGEIVLGGAVPGIRTPGGSFSRTTVRQRSFTQELRIASNDDARLQWLVGGFLRRARTDMEQRVVEPGVEQLAQSRLGLSILDIFGVPLLPGGQSYHSRQRIRERDVDAFGQLAWRFSPRWEAAAGLRVSRSTLSFRLMSEGPFAGGSNAIGPRRQRGTPVTPYASLSFRPAAHSLIYASAGKGFRGGGTNGAVPSGNCAADLSAFGRTAAPESYGPDSLWSYEAGVKAGGLSGRVHLALAAFRIDWRNIQQSVTLPNCGFSYIDNLGGARNQGAEFTLRARPFGPLTIDMSVGYVDARFRRHVGPPTPDATGSIVAAGDRIPYVPRWSGTLAAEYGFSPGAGLQAFVRGEWQHAGGFRRAPSVRSVAYDPRVYRGEATDLLLFRAGVGRDGWEVSAFADNLLDRRAILYRNADLVPVTGSPLRQMAQRPRTIGLTASLSY